MVKNILFCVSLVIYSPLLNSESYTTYSIGEYDYTDGLKMINPDMGATTWSLISSPSATYQLMYRFFNDAFAILETGQRTCLSIFVAIAHLEDNHQPKIDGNAVPSLQKK